MDSKKVVTSVFVFSAFDINLVQNRIDYLLIAKPPAEKSSSNITPEIIIIQMDFHLESCTSL